MEGFKLLVMLLATPIILLVGCNEPTHHPKSTDIVLSRPTGNLTLEKVTIDGCEYFIYLSNGTHITHKGDCKNHGDEKEF